MGDTDGAKAYPVVLRFEGMSPDQIARYEAHRARRGGDVGHIDLARTKLNRRLHGKEDWARQALEEIKTMRVANFANELEALRKRRRSKELERRIIEGPRDPWRASRHGPLREVILTANKDWFADDVWGFLQGEKHNDRIDQFEKLAVAWLKHEFGDDLIHARADLDEQAYHIHAVIMPRVIVEIPNNFSKTERTTASRMMLQPSKFAILKDYEKAQDSVGQWFAPLGLVRGERRKQTTREALSRGEAPPPPRRHVRPRDWREAEERRLAAKAREIEERSRAVANREAEADAVLTVSEAVASGLVDPIASESAKLVAVDDGQPTEILARVQDKAERAPVASARVLDLFRRLWARAAERAQVEVQSQFRDALDDLREADRLVGEAAAQAPAPQREGLSRYRVKFGSLIQRIGASASRASIGVQNLVRRVEKRSDPRDSNGL